MSISKVNVSGADHQIVGSPRYATCSTAAATAAKVATIADGSSTFSLEKGARICVSFTYANTASAATLNVASTGAKAICWQGSALVSSQYWQAGAVVDFVYDGNGWSIVGIAKDNNSTNFLPLSGGTLTGSLTVGSSSIGTNGYIEGTWLKTTKATEKAGDFATISSDGWIYKRKPANVLGDIGGQAKITANGILKGDGTGTITAADETEVELVDITPESIGAQPKITANGFLTSDGKGNVQAGKPYFPIEITETRTPDDATHTYIYTYSANKTYQEIRTALAQGYIPIAFLGGLWFYFSWEYSSSNYHFLTHQQNNGNYISRQLQCSNDSTWMLTTCTCISREGSFNNSSSLTLPEVIQTLENETESIKEKTKSIYLPTASWTGSDPYTQTITYSFPTNAKVNIQPSEELYDQLVADSVGYLAIKNVDGTFTAVAKGGKPSVNLDVQVTYNQVW